MICGNASSSVLVDPERATLGNLVEDVLRQELGYGNEISVMHEANIIYDPDAEDNLIKKFADLGLKADSVITIIDEGDDDPRVNLSLSISEQALPEDKQPVLLFEKIDIPRKPKQANGANGSSAPNGNDDHHREKRKRTASITTEPEPKGKKQAAGTVEDALLVEDPSGGAIVLE